MSLAWDEVKDFWDYLECYPFEGEPGYDGIHNGGIKGIAEDAPEQAKKAFVAYQEQLKSGYKL